MSILPNRGFYRETTTNSTRARKMSNTLGNASKEGNDTHGRHRRRPGKSRARFSSDHRTSPHLEGNWAAPSKRLHTTATATLADVAAKSRTDDQPPGRVTMATPPTPNLDGEPQPSHPSTRSRTTRDGRRPLQGTALRWSDMPQHSQATPPEGIDARHTTQG